MALNPNLAIDNNGSPSPPFTRDSSPSPSISPTPALSACPALDRSFSTASSASTFSGHSVGSRSSSGSAVSRRRGYVRPQGAWFADSAKNRDSVMSLGSIAHLQYYFARTGLLDGKGGRLAKNEKKDNTNSPNSLDNSIAIVNSSSASHLGGDFVDSPIKEKDEYQDWEDSMMLPPTVSTYSHRDQYIPPPPDAKTLRTNLKKALGDAEKALFEVGEHDHSPLNSSLRQGRLEDEHEPRDQDEMHGWYQIQGMHILDVFTLAIRAAKIYYTTHEHPQRLAGIKSERRIREELLGVLDVLKRMATRNFAGGVRTEELQTMRNWLRSVTSLLEQEQDIERQEARDRSSWTWLEGTWDDSDREREHLFMQTFLTDEALPLWTAPSDVSPLPTPFLEALRNGLLLVRLHNAVLKKSKRQFGEIKAFHEDTLKPYRCADNLRYWVKAAEIRWETKIRIDVMGVVYGVNEEAWKSFDAAILTWCKAVREEITREWKSGCVVVSSALSQGDV
ncbi:hypothetical protein MMC20_008037 [Loxospora ochrophaea]|nr:hypothetical protein [Loxospora ochrophaea]